MNTKRSLFKQVVLLAGIAIIAVAMTSCGAKKEAAKPAKGPDAKAAYAAYKQILENNRDGIMGYNFQNDRSGAIAKPVAFYDIDGDKIPELFFMTVSDPANYMTAELKIYTYKKGKAEEMSYGVTDYNTESGPLRDACAAGGTHYIIYCDKDSKHLIIQHGICDENWYSWIDRFEIKDGSKRDFRLYNFYGYADGDWLSSDYNGNNETTVDRYYENGKLIDRSAGMSKFTETQKNLGQVIMFSYAASGEDLSIWKNFDPASASQMSYDDAIAYIDKRI